MLPTGSEADAWPRPEARRKRPAAEWVAASLLLVLAAGAMIAARLGLPENAAAEAGGRQLGRRRLDDDGPGVVNVTQEQLLGAFHAEPEVGESAAVAAAVLSASNLRSSAAVGSWMCSNKCYTWAGKGFLHSDCSCSVHSNWYMWVCKSHRGTPIKTQYCNSRDCGGCAAPSVPAHPTPTPSPDSRQVPAPGCSSGSTECTHSKCCASPGFKCYQKNSGWASCLKSCRPGINWNDPPKYRTAWSCNVLGSPETHHHAPAPVPAPSPPSVEAPTPPVPAAPPAPSSSSDASGTDDPASPMLLPSSGKLNTFYVYRVQSDQDYPPENQNMANLAGAMWYLHHEIVNNRWERRFKKTRLQRFKVSTKAPQPLVDLGMNFGLRHAFDLGQCTGPYECQESFKRVGYVVGCNDVGSFPTQQWAGQVFYNNAIWYSFPGKCSSKKHFEQTPECKLEDPGGACKSPTGQGSCTYSYEFAGEISIDKLEGNKLGFPEFAARGGWEYNNQTDKGVQMTFWDGIRDADACQARLDQAMNLFDEQNPDMPPSASLPAPTCDFDEEKYFSVVPRVDPHRETVLLVNTSSGK